MKALPNSWNFIMTLIQENILKGLEFDDWDVESISLSYDSKKDEETPCLAILTVADQLVYFLCITRILRSDEPSFILCGTNVDDQGKLEPVQIRSRNDVLHIQRKFLPLAIRTVLEEALACKGEECSV